LAASFVSTPPSELTAAWRSTSLTIGNQCDQLASRQTVADSVRRIAANIAKLPDLLLGFESRG
jgi:hypothetical protein